MSLMENGGRTISQKLQEYNIQMDVSDVDCSATGAFKNVKEQQAKSTISRKIFNLVTTSK